MLGLFLGGCAFSYSQKVKTLSDYELCSNFGKYSLYEHKEGLSLTAAEIKARNETIDKPTCSDTANNTFSALSPKYKLKLCQHLAAYHYKGSYEHYSNTLKKIERLGFADEECSTMVEFYYIKLARKQEKSEAISNALRQVADNMKESNEHIYGPGTRYNPIHLKIE